MDQLKILTAAHVDATSRFIHTHFPHLLPVLKFSSKFVEDMQEVLSSGCKFTFLFRGTYPGAHGRTIGSTTDINLRHGIGEANMSRVFQDLLAFETENIDKFRHEGGDATFRATATPVSPEWRECINLSDQMYLLAVELLTASGVSFISALLSQPVRKCLTVAGVVLPATQFVFTNHASCLRGSGDRRSALKREIHYSECRNLRIQAQVIRGSCTTVEAKLMVDTAMNRNHDDMTEFCIVHGIVPARNSFRFCPYEVVVCSRFQHSGRNGYA